jgi:aryl-alcohol dehydrogenase-like predicted oxidoreductase
MGTSFGRSVEQEYADRLFDTYIRLGGNCFDTSLVYYDVEITLGNWMITRRNRKQIILHAKAAHHETIQADGSYFEYHRSRLTPKEIRQDLGETLRRLQTDYVDLYGLHRDDPDQPIGPIMECLADEQQAGRIRAFVASNWSIPRLEEANTYAAEHGIPGFAASSPNLALAYPNEPSWPNCLTACDHYSRAWYACKGLPLFAWSCLALGFFSNQYRPLEHLTTEQFNALMQDRWTSDVIRVYYSERNFERLARANFLAKQKKVTSTQIAMAWVLHQGPHVFAIAGPQTEEEVSQLFDAFQIDLSAQEAAWLNLETD